MNDQIIGVGSILGRYKIERELGRGGMGVVYKAHELSLNRKVAVKVLSQRFSSEEEFVKRFKREAQIVAALNHPNIVNILSYEEENGLHYFSMEYVSGKDLGKILKERELIPVEEALSIIAQTAGALNEASARGVVHRDLKPSNIMIDKMGKVKVTDFGVAYFQDTDTKLTKTGMFLGTPEYASPEQATGRPLDVRSDIYALGAVLYRMLSGKPPVTGESPLAVVTKIATEPPVPIGEVNPSVQKPLRILIERMMAKDPEDRLQSPKEVLREIDDCINKLKVEVPLVGNKIGGKEATSHPLPKQKFYAGLVGVVGIISAALLILWIVKGGFPDGIWKEKSALVSKVEKEGKVPAAKIEPVDEKQATSLTSVSGVDEIKEGVSMDGRKSAPKSFPPIKIPVLPKIPTVLMVVSGDESLAMLTRSYLESMVIGSGLRLTTISEIPTLREKAQYGDMPVTWYSIKRFIPSDKAHILLLAQIQKTGSVVLNYYGQSREQTIATYSVRAVDMATGASVAVPASGSVKFTSLNMEENVKEVITSSGRGIGEEIKKYWENKLGVAPKDAG